MTYFIYESTVPSVLYQHVGQFMNLNKNADI